MPNITDQTKHRRSSTVVSIKLPFPVTPDLRLAQLTAAPVFEGVKPFASSRWNAIQVFRPNVLVGSIPDLQRIGEMVQKHTIDLSSLDHALVVLTRYGSEPVTDLLRVTLWQTFGVPIYELYLGLDNSLLAAECEAHEGWHLAPDIRFEHTGGELILDGAGNNGLHTGLNAVLDESPCSCGRVGPRLIEVKRNCLAVSA